MLPPSSSHNDGKATSFSVWVQVAVAKSLRGPLRILNSECRWAQEPRAIMQKDEILDGSQIPDHLCDLLWLCFPRLFQKSGKQLHTNQYPVPSLATMSFLNLLPTVYRSSSFDIFKFKAYLLSLLLWSLGKRFMFILALHIFGKSAKSACLLYTGNCGFPVRALDIKAAFYLPIEKR